MSPVLETGVSGVTMPVGTEWFPAGTRFRMLRDRCLIRVLAWNPSRVVKVEYGGKPVRGVVAAIGPGGLQKRYYRNLAGEVYKYGETGRIVPCDARVGDTVEVGGLEIRGYSFPEIMIGDVLHILCSEADIAIIDEEPFEFEDTAVSPIPLRGRGAMVQHSHLRERTTVKKFSKSHGAAHGHRSR